MLFHLTGQTYKAAEHVVFEAELDQDCSPLELKTLLNEKINGKKVVAIEHGALLHYEKTTKIGLMIE